MPEIQYTAQDVKSLKQLSDRFRDLAVQTDVVIEMMEIDQVKTLDTTNYKSMIKAIAVLERWCYELRSSFMTHRHDQGKFVAEGHEIPELHPRERRQSERQTQKRKKATRSKR